MTGRETVCRARNLRRPVLGLLLAAGAAAACAGGGAEDGADGRGAPGKAVTEEAREADTAGLGDEAGADEGAPTDSHAVRADTTPGDSAPTDTASVAGDTPWAAPPSDSTRRYFVRLREGTDPEAVARRHGLEPLRVIRSPVPALYVSLAAAEVEALRADSSVVSLSLEIHQGDTLGRPPVRGVPGPDSSG